MRPGGYSFEDALALISALGEDGRHVYLRRQIPLDTMYPALLAISTASSLYWLAQSVGMAASLYRANAVTAYLAAIADYTENGLIIWMLHAGHDRLDSLVVAASLATISKSALSTIVFITLLIAFADFAVRRTRGLRRIRDQNFNNQGIK